MGVMGDDGRHVSARGMWVKRLFLSPKDGMKAVS